MAARCEADERRLHEQQRQAEGRVAGSTPPLSGKTSRAASAGGGGAYTGHATACMLLYLCSCHCPPHRIICLATACLNTYLLFSSPSLYPLCQPSPSPLPRPPPGPLPLRPLPRSRQPLPPLFPLPAWALLPRGLGWRMPWPWPAPPRSCPRRPLRRRSAAASPLCPSRWSSKNSGD